MQGNKPNISLSVLGSSLDSFEIFKKIEQGNLSKATVIWFESNFINDIYNNNISLKIIISIKFNSENYIISSNMGRLIKYYDEKIIDNDTKELIKKILRDVMVQMRKIKK